MYRLPLSAAVFVAALILAGCGSSSSSPDMAFVTSRDGDYAIYTVSADGGGEKRLTERQTIESQSPRQLFREVEPAWSPDAKHIAFASGRNGVKHLFAMNADGTATVRLTSGKNPDANPSWSPDGSRIVFDGGLGDLYSMRSDGRDVKRLTTTASPEERDPAWSPDGRWIAYERREPGGPTREIWVIRPDGSDARQVTTFGTQSYGPSWSPDSKRLLFTSNVGSTTFHIYSIDLRGKSIIRRTHGEGDAFEPAWSRDGKLIAFSRDGAIYTVDVAGHEEKLTSGQNDGSPAWRPVQPTQSGY